MRHSDSPSLPRAEPGINGLTSWNCMSRFVEIFEFHAAQQKAPKALSGSSLGNIRISFVTT